MADRKSKPARPPPPSRRKKAKDQGFSATIRFSAGHGSGSEEDVEDVSVGFTRPKAKVPALAASKEMVDVTRSAPPPALEHPLMGSSQASDSSKGTLEKPGLSARENVPVLQDAGSRTSAGDEFSEHGSRDVGASLSDVPPDPVRPSFDELQQRLQPIAAGDYDSESVRGVSPRASPEFFSAPGSGFGSGYVTPAEDNQSGVGSGRCSPAGQSAGRRTSKQSDFENSLLSDKTVPPERPSSRSGRSSRKKTKKGSSGRFAEKSPSRDMKTPAEEQAVSPLSEDSSKESVGDDDVLALLLPVRGGRLFRKHLFFSCLLFAAVVLIPSDFARGVVIGSLCMCICGSLLVQAFLSGRRESKELLARGRGVAAKEVTGAEWIIPAMQPQPVMEVSEDCVKGKISGED